MSPRPGEVWLADLGMAAKTRPVVVVSRYDEDPPRVLVLYVPLTSENRGSEYEVEMPKLPFRGRFILTTRMIKTRQMIIVRQFPAI